MELPKQGIPEQELFARMRERKGQDADWEAGRGPTNDMSPRSTFQSCGHSSME
jgi:hypothetical protein